MQNNLLSIALRTAQLAGLSSESPQEGRKERQDQEECRECEVQGKVLSHFNLMG